MKNSECFKLAQLAVIECQTINSTAKLEILRALMSEEDIAKLVEKNKESGLANLPSREGAENA